VIDTASESLHRILREYAPMAHRLALSHEADRELAKDLAQDILVAVWRAWPAFKQQCSERTYVARIAHHRIVTHIARSAARPPFTDLSDELPCSGYTPEDQAIRSDARQALVAAIRSLPMAYRDVAVLLLEGLTPSEVAETLGLTQNAVSIRGVRARQMLRDLLKGSV
jgi:RNA polymerase sigma factor (sigma-70 family)